MTLCRSSMYSNHLDAFLGNHVYPIVKMSITVKRFSYRHVLTSEILQVNCKGFFLLFHSCLNLFDAMIKAQIVIYLRTD